MQHKLIKWVTDRLEAAPSPDALALFHTSAEMMGPDLICRFPIGKVGEERRPLEDEVARVVNDVLEQTQEHCEAFAGRQRYKLVAEKDERPVAQLSFIIGVAKPENGPLGADMMSPEVMSDRRMSEVERQLMRHNEVYAGKIIELTQVLTGPLISENANLRKQRDAVETRRIEAYRAEEDLYSQKQERDLILAEAKEARERREKILDSLFTKWGPEIAARFMANFQGAKALPEGSSDNGGHNGTNGHNGSNGSARGLTVAGAQQALRDVFKTIDRAPILECLDDSERQKLDGLLGLGADPGTIDQFRGDLIAMWQQLPDEVTSAIQNNLDTEKIALFLSLMGAQ